MKNPFVKHNNTALIASIALGTAAVGAAAYLFLTEKGSGLRQQLIDRFSSAQDNEATQQDHTAYLKRPRKAAITDRNDLLHHGTINEQPNLAS